MTTMLHNILGMAEFAKGGVARGAVKGVLVGPLSRSEPEGRFVARIGENAEAITSFHPRIKPPEISIPPPIDPEKKLIGDRFKVPTNPEDQAFRACALHLPHASLRLNPMYPDLCRRHRLSQAAQYALNPAQARESVLVQSGRFIDLLSLFPENRPGQELKQHAEQWVDFLRPLLPICLPPTSEIHVGRFVQEKVGYLQSCLRFMVANRVRLLDEKDREFRDKNGSPIRTSISCIVRIHTKVSDTLDGVELDALFEYGVVLPMKTNKGTEVVSPSELSQSARLTTLKREQRLSPRNFILLGDFAHPDSWQRPSPLSPKATQDLEIRGINPGGVAHLGVSNAMLSTLTKQHIEHLRVKSDGDAVGLEDSHNLTPHLTLVDAGLKDLLVKSKADNRLAALGSRILPAIHHPIPCSAEEITKFVRSLETTALSVPKIEGKAA